MFIRVPITNLHFNIDVFWSNWSFWDDDCLCWIGDNYVCHQQLSSNPQTFHVRQDFLLGLPTITSILRRISVVRSWGYQVAVDKWLWTALWKMTSLLVCLLSVNDSHSSFLIIFILVMHPGDLDLKSLRQNLAALHCTDSNLLMRFLV